MYKIRPLIPSDWVILEKFLLQYKDSSTFLRANLQRAGIHCGSMRSQGTYVGAFDSIGLSDVAAHYWDNNVILQSPNCPAEVAEALIRASARPVNGVLGPWSQVEVAKDVLKLDPRRLGKVVPEYLYKLDLARFMFSTDFNPVGTTCRLATHQDLDVLVKWRRVYDRITIGFSENSIDDSLNSAILSLMIEEERLWVAENSGELVATSGFSAALQDVVKVTGVYTPQRLRNQGFARCVIAASLSREKNKGVEEALLYTEMDNYAAQNTYESLGFKKIGKYGMIVLDPI